MSEYFNIEDDRNLEDPENYAEIEDKHCPCGEIIPHNQRGEDLCEDCDPSPLSEPTFDEFYWQD